jgi:hypothetical protein
VNETTASYFFTRYIISPVSQSCQDFKEDTEP